MPDKEPRVARPKKKFDLHDLVDTGKKWAGTAVVVAAFAHGLYAAYIKEEEVAKKAYNVQRTALEGFSDHVDLEVASLKGRVESLERVCMFALVSNTGLGSAMADAPTPLAAGRGPASEEEGEEAEETTSTDGDEVKSMPKSAESKPPPHLEQHSLKVRLPDKPWEKDKK